jgi:adenylosuccinate synthase
LEYVPTDIEMFNRCEPVYIDFPGWKTPTNKIRRWKDLPLPTRTYLKALAEFTGAKLSIVSVGPARAQTIAL